MKKKIVVALSGASGAPLAVELLKTLAETPSWETHLVMSSSFRKTLEIETVLTPGDLHVLADKIYDNTDIGGSIASGTFKTDGMIVVPCSMKTLSGIASGYSDNLILRAADVTIKERRKLVLVVRESPLSSIHLRNMLLLAQLGVIIMPPMLTYYNLPTEISQITQHITGKILNEFNINMPGFKRWE